MFVFAGTIRFSFTMKLAIGPERFVTINGDTKTKNVPNVHHLSNYQSSVIYITSNNGFAPSLQGFFSPRGYFKKISISRAAYYLKKTASKKWFGDFFKARIAADNNFLFYNIMYISYTFQLICFFVQTFNERVIYTNI